LNHGCPPQAIVAAFGFDERTVASWEKKGGKHCQRVHEHKVQQGQVNLKHVQADEMLIKMVCKKAWMAMAIAVPSRLWLGGAISLHRDKALITRLVHMVRSCARNLSILVCVDGLSSYITAFKSVFRNPVYTGLRGRPRLVLPSGFLMGQVIKQSVQRRLKSVSRRVVKGSREAIKTVITATKTGTDINTAYIERLNATFRSYLTPLVRRGRAIARKTETLSAVMYLLGCSYNFCWYHGSLRKPSMYKAGRKWEHKTPAMAAGLTDHKWTMLELLSYQVPLSPWKTAKKTNRKFAKKQVRPPPLSIHD
jgi:transposase-like protein